jgi:putative zinc finger/helix-turn-helix YgiT family protein
MEHDGRLYSLTIPNLEILECAVCHNRTLPDAAFARVMEELRVKAGLMNPAEIRANRKRLGFTQEELAKYLGVAKETVSRWETGAQIQQRAMNDLLGAFFNVPELREYYRQLRGLPPILGSTPILGSNTLIAQTAPPAISHVWHFECQHGRLLQKISVTNKPLTTFVSGSGVPDYQEIPDSLLQRLNNNYAVLADE